jgi:predicted nucleic acid-binding protein
MAEREKEVRLVADTNIILSALLKDGSFIAEMMKTDCIQIYFPEYGLSEIDAHKIFSEIKDVEYGVTRSSSAMNPKSWLKTNL